MTKTAKLKYKDWPLDTPVALHISDFHITIKEYWKQHYEFPEAISLGINAFMAYQILLVPEDRSIKDPKFMDIPLIIDPEDIQEVYI